MHIINLGQSKLSTFIGTTKKGPSINTAMKNLNCSLLKASDVEKTEGFVSNDHNALKAATSFNAIAAESTTGIQNFQNENLLLMPTTSLSHIALEQNRLYNCALSKDQFHCSQYKATTATSPLVSCVSNTIDSGTTGVDLLAYDNNKYSQGSMYDYNNPRIFYPEEPKPQHSYIGLIAMAILSSAETKLVLSDIYQHILDNYPYFRARGPGWRNSIRHNLSLNDCFIKSGRSANGKGHYWAIHPANIEDFRKGDFRRRKAQRKVRKHMGLPLDSAGTDSPSPPPPQIELSSSSSPLTYANLLNIAKKKNTVLSRLHSPSRYSLSFVQQKYQLDHHHLLLYPSLLSLEYAQPRPEIHNNNFNTSIIDNYTALQSNLHYADSYTKRFLSHEPETSAETNPIINSRIGDNAMLLIAQKNSNSNINSHDDSKHTCHNQKVSNITSNSIGSLTGFCTPTRKRQFDVASILAPDHKDTNASTDWYMPTWGMSAMEHKITKKFSLNYKEQGQSQRASPIQEQEEIVDVVDGDNEDKYKQKPFSILIDTENKYKYGSHYDVRIGNENLTVIAQEKGNKRCDDVQSYSDLSFPKTPNSTQEQFADDYEAAFQERTSLADFQACSFKNMTPQSTSFLTPIISKSTSSMVDYISSENIKRSVNQLYSYAHTKNEIINVQQHHQHVRQLMHHLTEQTDNLENLESNEKCQALSQHYGCYMAAMERICRMQLPHLERHPPLLKPQRQQRK